MNDAMILATRYPPSWRRVTLRAAAACVIGLLAAASPSAAQDRRASCVVFLTASSAVLPECTRSVEAREGGLVDPATTQWRLRAFSRATLFLLVLSSAVSAAAQSSPSITPRVELGAGVLVMGGWADFSDFIGDIQPGLAGIEFMMRAALAPRFALEGRVAFSDVDRVSTTWYEFGAVMRTQPPTLRKWNRFFRIGVGGHREVEQVPEYRHENQDRSTTVFPAYTHYKATPPNFVVGGAGFQRAVSRRLAVVTELDLIVGPSVGMGLRVSAGVSIPLGTYGGP